MRRGEYLAVCSFYQVDWWVCCSRRPSYRNFVTNESSLDFFTQPIIVPPRSQIETNEWRGEGEFLDCFFIILSQKDSPLLLLLFVRWRPHGNVNGCTLQILSLTVLWSKRAIANSREGLGKFCWLLFYHLKQLTHLLDFSLLRSTYEHPFGKGKLKARTWSILAH